MNRAGGADRSRGTPDEERRKLFRRMTVIFVWLPPLLILVLAASMALLLAVVFPIGELGYWARWGVWTVVFIVVPGLAYVMWNRLRNGE